MKQLFLFISVVALALSCGNKTGAVVSDADTLTVDSIVDMEAYRHSDVYICQRIDTIYKYMNDSACCSQRYYALMTEASFLCEETGDILYDYDHWVCGQDYSDDWSYKVMRVYNITDSTALVDMIIHNFVDHETTIALYYERGDWYVDDFNPSDDGEDDKKALRGIIRDGLEAREKAKDLVGSWGWVGENCPELLLSFEMTSHGLKCTECTIYRLDGFDHPEVTFNGTELWVNEEVPAVHPKKRLYLHLQLDQNGDLTGGCTIRHLYNGAGYEGPITLRKGYFRYRDGAQMNMSDYAE